jgi:spore maturation protein SpmA
MALNYIWIGFFLIAFVFALVKLIVFGDQEVFTKLFDATIDSSKLGFEISLGLTGVLTFWMGLLNIAEKSGITKIMIRWFGPFLVKLFPNIQRTTRFSGRYY